MRFIGRGDYIQKLWMWLCDPYSPIRLLSGYGGAGKTTLAREFAEDVVRSAVVGLEFVIWVSAKPRVYLPSKGKFIESNKVHFSDVDTLLKSLLLELGTASESLDPESTRLELVERLTDTLRIMPSLLIIDDIDSLIPEDQHDVFHMIVQVIDRTFGTKAPASRARLTARLDLGAAASQLIRVAGLELNEFCEYVSITAEAMQMPWSAGAQSKLMRKFHTVTDGSPTFAAAILRLVEMGQTIEKALEHWRGSDGEEVRAVTFKRELDRLSDSQVRTLYAASCLGETTLIELQNVLEGSESLLKDDIGGLRKYNLLAVGGDIPNSGVRLIVPNSIQVMQDLIKNRVRSHNKIELAASRIRKKGGKAEAFDQRITRSATAMLISGDGPKAVETLSWADKQYQNQPDLKFLLGCAYLRLQPTNPKEADIEFRHAFDLGCRRTELTAMWVQAKTASEDWVGILDITVLPNRECPTGDDHLFRSQAYLKLSEYAERNLRLDSAATHCANGGNEINELLKSRQPQTRLTELIEWRVRLFEQYVRIKDQMHKDANEHLYVWDACVDAFRARVHSRSIIELGIKRLESWWEAVENRELFDFKTKEKMRYQIKIIEHMVFQLEKDSTMHEKSIELLKASRQDLEQRTDDYIA